MPPVSKSLPTLDRRRSLQLLASAVSLAAASCSRPEEEIVPYTDMPEGLVAGEVERYATTLSLAGFGRGFLGITVDGRPIKIEGNPRHPASLGATDVFAETEVLSLYDPGRAKTVRQDGRITSWDSFETAWSALPNQARVGLVTGRILSFTTLKRIEALRKRFAALRWYRYEPIHDDQERQGARLAFGRPLACQYDLAAADAVLCLDADPLGHGPAQLSFARAFSERRSTPVRQKLCVVEPAWTLTGATADQRLVLPPWQIGEFGRAIGNGLGANLGRPRLGAPDLASAQKVGEILTKSQGRALVLAGRSASAELHALSHWMNARLRAPVRYHEPLDPVAEDHAAAVAALTRDLEDGALDAVVFLDRNFLYDVQHAAKLELALQRVPLRVQVGQHADETAALCQWQLPLSHPLESWADARASGGEASLVQPLIRRLYDSRSVDEILALMAEEQVRKDYDLTRATWEEKAPADFENWWRKALYQGVIGQGAVSALEPGEPKSAALPYAEPGTALTLMLVPHHALWDGRYAHNAWLQECPAPFTKEVWGNALHLSPEDAQEVGVADGDTVAMSFGERTITAPAVVMAGQAKGVVWACLGGGRRKAGKIGTDVGQDYGALRHAPLSFALPGVTISKSAEERIFRSTQAHTRLQGRAEDLFRITTPQALGRHQEPLRPPQPSLLPEPSRGDYAWAMVIDTDLCIGCNACVVACQAENNVPVVGPEEISLGRDMHWLRVDSYALEQKGEHLRGFQTVPCMHCELAPCEPVCPVEASVHDHQGLNVQVYNRCIGTRFCEANCPYKVRRFNWFDYAGEQALADQREALKPQHNPDVSVRGRGVMEKCNYCLQRISRARRAAEKEGRRVADGEVVTACQAACPTRAIHFGDLNTAGSDIVRLQQDQRRYTLLEELNTRPRTTFLKRIYDDEDGA